MLTLNLVYPDKSDIQYTLNKYPDGQQDLTILGWEKGGPFEWEEVVKAYPITIKSRLNSFKDLELIVCAKKILDDLGFNNITLYVPYFLGSRSDRKFQEGGVHYLKDVICPIINSLKFDEVIVLDPHSDVLEACINNFRKESNLKVVEFALWNLYKEKAISPKQTISETLNCILVSPDAGASKKIYKLAEQIGYNGDIITCSKDRDADGKLTKCVVPKFDYKKDVIIIDDIFDYGKTFTNILEEINKNTCDLISPIGKKYLVVTHSIQEEGLIKASKLFDCIYTTNSYQDLMPDTRSLVKQFNVFN